VERQLKVLILWISTLGIVAVVCKKHHAHLLCKHLVHNTLRPPNKWWPKVFRSHILPFYQLPGTRSECEPLPEVVLYHWLVRMPAEHPPAPCPPQWITVPRSVTKVSMCYSSFYAIYSFTMNRLHCCMRSSVLYSHHLPIICPSCKGVTLPTQCFRSISIFRTKISSWLLYHYFVLPFMPLFNFVYILQN